MNSFDYTAIDREGRATTGRIDAPDWPAAEMLLAAQGLGQPKQVSASAIVSPAPSKGPSKGLSLGHDAAVELVTYLTELARSGLPLGAGLHAIAKDLSSKANSKALHSLAARIESGQSLEEALGAISGSLPAAVAPWLAAGARSGQLVPTLDGVLVQLRQHEDRSRRFWQAVFYPVVLLTFLLAWLLFAAVVLVPMLPVEWIDEVYDSFGMMKPKAQFFPNSSAKNLNEFAREFPTVLKFAVGAVAILLATAWLLGQRGAISRTIAQLPLVGPAWWYRGLTEFCGFLSAFLQAELPLPDALRLTSIACHDQAIRQACRRAADKAAAGSSLSQCLAGRSLFPATLLNLVEWGEGRAALINTLDGAQQMFADRFDNQLQTIRQVLPPLAFIVVVGCTLFFAMTVYGSIAVVLRLITSF